MCAATAEDDGVAHSCSNDRFGTGVANPGDAGDASTSA